jgi:glycosyltransferase involved in cell wall biosynthesis
MEFSFNQTSAVEDALFVEFVKEHMDTQAYLEAYPDVRLAGVDPVEHWLEHGMAEGRFLYPGATVIVGDVAARLDDSHWKRFTWRGHPVAVQINRPIKPFLIDQIKAQARHDPAVLAAGAFSIGKLRQHIAPDLLGRSGVDVRSIFAAIPERPDVVILLPHLRVGGADKYAADLVASLSTLGHESILVIVTSDQADTCQDWDSFYSLIPFKAVNVVFWKKVCGPNSGPLFLARLIHALRPPKVVVINSRIGLDVVAQYGRGLSQCAKLYCTYFSLHDVAIPAPYGARYPSRTLPYSIGLTDNAEMAKTLRRLWGDLPGPGIEILPPRLQPAEDLVFSARLRARQLRTVQTSRSLRWVWISRVEPLKGTAIIAELARTRPRDQFDIFGPLEGCLAEMGLKRSNITYHGILADIPSADLTDYDGFVFTSLFEGMPNVVLEISQHAIPMVLADVGGLRDTFDDTSAIFVQHAEDTSQTAKAFAKAMDEVAKLTSQVAVTKAHAARTQAIARHAPDVYLKNVAGIFEAWRK